MAFPHPLFVSSKPTSGSAMARMWWTSPWTRTISSSPLSTATCDHPPL